MYQVKILTLKDFYALLRSRIAAAQRILGALLHRHIHTDLDIWKAAA